MSIDTTTIEIGVATYEGDLQTWFNAYVELPFTLESDILLAATEKFQNDNPNIVVAGTFFIGVVDNEGLI